MFAYSPVSCRSLAIARSLFPIPIRGRDEAIAMCAVFVSSFSCVICWRMMTRRRRRLVREAGGVADAGFAGDGGDDGDDGGYCGDDGPGESGVSGTMGECLACLGDFSMRKRRERADSDTRSEAIVSGVGRFLTHFVRPFSIAHLRRRAGGIWLLFTFRQRLVFLPVLSYPYLRSLISFPFTMSVGVSGVAWGDMLRRVGGVILLLVPRSVPSSRSAARSIFLVSACGRMWCAVFVSSFSCVIRWRLVVSFSFSSRPSSRLPVSCGRLVSILCGSLAHPFYLIGSSASRFSLIACLVRRSLMSCLCVSSRRRPVLSVSPGVSLSSQCSLVSLGGSSRRLVERDVSSVIRLSFRSLSVLVSSHSLPFHGHDCGGSSFAVSYRCGVFPSRCPVVESDWAITVGGNWRAARRYGGTRRFIQLVFPIRAGNEMTMMI